MILFLILIVSPTVISLTDSDTSISIVLEDFGEEEKKGKESSESKLDSEFKIHPSSSNKSLHFSEYLKKTNVVFQSKNYISEYPKITTPPPKVML
jgi:hypothetical protein